MNLLIAVDELSGPESALADLQRAGLPQQADAVVLCVADVILPASDRLNEQPAPKYLVDDIEKARARGMQAVDQARSAATGAQQMIQRAFPDWTVRAEALADSPAWAIVRRAEEVRADLIVVGSHTRSALRRLMLGSVSQSVLHNASTSVRISRHPARQDDAPIHLVAGEDGSADALAALLAIASRNWRHGTTVHLVTAVDQVVAAQALGPDARAQGSDWVHQLNSRSVAKLCAAGLTVSPVVAHGEPRKILLEEAERLNADCIFVGARGLRGIERLLLGSVSSAIAARAHCSVEVVRSRENVARPGNV
ncbi:MAG: universal stress protein [Bryobacterales bacterium]|nr:universal stress protein [Bryobacterales bacterium]